MSPGLAHDRSGGPFPGLVGRVGRARNAPVVPRDTGERVRLGRRYARQVSTQGKQSQEGWTTRRLLAWMGEAFTRKGLESPRLQAELLLAHVIGCERLRLYMEADRPASPLEREKLRDLVG